jgi:hypothetical protein
MLKRDIDTIVNLKDVAVGLSIIIGKEGMKTSLNRDVIQKTNITLMTVLKEIDNCFGE